MLEQIWGDTPCPRAKENSSKMVEGAKSHSESNPICTRNAQRAQTNLVQTRTQRPHRDQDRTVLECLLWQYRSAVDCSRGRGSGCRRPGYDISPLGGCCHNPTIEPPELTQLWNQTRGRHKQNLVWTRTQEKVTVALQETDPDLSVNVQESLVEAWNGGGLLQA